MHYLYCIVVCSALQGMPSLSAHSWGLCEHETIKYKNETHTYGYLAVFSMQCE